MAQAAIPIAVAVIGAAVGAGAGALLAPKPQMPQQVKPITRNDAAAAASRDREFRLRRGAGANELTGGGAEAPSPGGKTLLGQ
jgi:hypothetical protein